MNSLTALLTFAITLSLTVAPLLAHEGEDHEHHHDDEHPTHLPVDYSLGEDSNAYPAPAPAGDGHFWWRGNLHTHTLWSDGDQFPEVVTQWYVQNGYHFLTLSDHNILSRGQKWIQPEVNPFIRRGGHMDAVELYRERFGDDWVEVRTIDEELREYLLSLSAEGGHLAQRPPEDQIGIGETVVRLKPLNEFRHLFERAGRFALIEAEEITTGRHVVHVNATNIGEKITPQDGETVEETIRLNVDAVVEQRERLGRAMMPHLNHPNFQWAVTAEDMAPVENLRFFEVYNGHRGVRNLGDEIRPDLDRMWDIVLTRRLAELGLDVVYGLAVDDAHHYEDSNSEVARPGRGWVMVRSRFLTPANIVNALESGDFYSSTGVTLRRVEASSNALAVEVEPEENVTYTIQFIGTREGYDADREPHLDADGNPRTDVTMQYSDEVGDVLEEVEGSSARYTFDGDEIYVRARVISSKLHPNPYAEGEHEQAWVQPVVPAR